MQLGKKARRLVMAGAFAVTGIIATVNGGASASAADQLPAYSTPTFCFTHVINLGQPSIEGKTCSGFYRVTKATYKFTQDNLRLCPRMGTLVHLDERWISPPTGGAPTILASYHAYL
jgi:hypothetical protein